ncbi:MAG: cell envelope integrity protein CreD [Alphaproteobacteria bacterium]
MTNSIAFRAVLIFVLTISMLVPLLMIDDIVRDRGRLYRTVTNNIAQQWAGEQTFSGPILSVPYTFIQMKEEKVKNEDGTYTYIKRPIEYSDTFFLLPDNLEIDGSLAPEKRRRGIYESVVYASELKVAAQFGKPDFKSLNINPKTIYWDRSTLHFGLSETKGINDDVKLTVNKQSLSLNSGTGIADFIGNGFSAPISKAAKNNFDLELTLPIRGSQAFYFTPFGKRTKVSINSSWPSPSFTGTSLPTEREISQDGFSAKWATSHLARSYPQAWIRSQSKSVSKMMKVKSGIRLVEPVWLYLQTERSIKYAILLIGLTFLGVLMLEHGFKLRFHPVQYGVVASALTMVYLLILGLSEHIGFSLAYLIAASTVVLMTSAYAHASLRAIKLTAWLTAVLATLFGVLYVILNMEDYALLSGSILMMVVIAILMITTRNLSTKANQTSN